MPPDLNPLEALWESTTRIDRSLSPARLASLPEAARCYVEHAGTALATAVRLRMHGEIKRGRWWPFRAEEVIHRNRGMVWQAIVAIRPPSLGPCPRARHRAVGRGPPRGRISHALAGRLAHRHRRLRVGGRVLPSHVDDASYL
jgi:hypothetical protein